MAYCVTSLRRLLSLGNGRHKGERSRHRKNRDPHENL
jgi:hypothetical protein